MPNVQKVRKTKQTTVYNMIDMPLSKVELQENNHSTPDEFTPKNSDKDTLVIFKNEFPFLGAFYPRNCRYFLLCKLHHYEVFEKEKLIKLFFQDDIMFRYLPADSASATNPTPDSKDSPNKGLVSHNKD